MLAQGICSTRAELARGEGVSRAAVTIGLRKLLHKRVVAPTQVQEASTFNTQSPTLTTSPTPKA